MCRHGVDWYRSFGTELSPGPTIVTVTGDVQRAAVAELPLGRPIGEVIDELSGGVFAGRSIKAVLSGVATPVLTADRLDAPISYEGLDAAGSGLGSAGFIVYDDRRNMVDVAYQVSRFLHVESCGQCNSCKLGTLGVTELLEHLVLGTRPPGDALGMIRRHLGGLTDSARCYLPTQEQRLIASLLDRYPDDLAVRLAGIPGDPEVPLPKLVDMRGGAAVTVSGPPYKQPDWSYRSVPVQLTRR